MRHFILNLSVFLALVLPYTASIYHFALALPHTEFIYLFGFALPFAEFIYLFSLVLLAVLVYLFA